MIPRSDIEIKQELKDNARKGCNKCYGRGYMGWKEMGDKENPTKIYIPCGKCQSKLRDDTLVLKI